MWHWSVDGVESGRSQNTTIPVLPPVATIRINDLMWRLPVGLVPGTARAAGGDISLPRSLAVTAGLLAGGAIAGAAAGASVAVLVISFASGALPLGDIGMLAGYGAMFGAPLGAFIFPTAGWLFLRDIPFGRAIGWLVGGAVGGGYFGFFLAPRPSALEGSIVGACMGVVLAVLGARVFRGTPET